MTLELVGFLLLAAQPEATMRVSLKQAVEVALAPEGSPKMAIAQETMRQAEARRLETRGDLLPNLESSVADHRETVNLKAFGFNFNFPTINGFSFAIPSIVGPFSVFDARVTVQQTMLDFSTIRRYQASKVNETAAKSDFDATKNQISDQVARAYLTTLRADAALATARANVQLSQALLDQARRLKDAGTGTGIEVTRAEVQLANDQQRLVVATDDRRRAALNLLRAMGLKLDTPIELTDALSYKAADIGDLNSALAVAREMRAELKAQKQREVSARFNYSSVKDERLPSVAADANYGTIGTGLIGNQPTYTYGFSVRVPVFDGGKRDYRREETFSQYRQEQARLRDLEQQVELDVRLAFDSVHAAESEVKTAEDGLQLARQELAQAQRRYLAGVANGIEVTDAQNRLARAQENEIAALYDYNVARIDLATATGRIREYVNQ
ncbi:MAG TPA: TolC family protein [Bryobacteraceae bacterium]|nr:TolC family protein [Bryobacteraceae bacterium]